jgi:uroporphyrinogen-III decarboxylase
VVWSRKVAPHIYPVFQDIRDIDAVKPPKPGEAGLTPLFLTQLEIMGRKLESTGNGVDKMIKSMVPFGGVNPLGPMRYGTPEAVCAETRQVIETARGRRLLLSTGTGTSPEVTLENVRAMIDTALES